MAILVHVLAGIALLQSSLPVLVILGLELGLLVILYNIIRSPSPMPDYRKVTYHIGYWLLHMTDERQIKYERAYISFDGGFFILLTVTGGAPRKNIVVFNDQITTSQYRVMKLIGKAS